MNIIYKRADFDNIHDLANLKIKQCIYNANKENKEIQNEDLARKSIKKILEQELNKTIYFFIAQDTDTNKIIACNGFVLHQMVPSTSCLNGKVAYITSVYTSEEYRHRGIQKKLMQMNIDLLKKMKCNKIELDAVNPYAIKLYEDVGFKKVQDKFSLTLQS